MTARAAGELGPGDIVPVALATGVGATWTTPDGAVHGAPWDEAIASIRSIDARVGPRWLWWSGDTARAFVANDIHPTRCWDLAVVHRLLHGGWRSDPARVWAGAVGLDVESIPDRRPVDLFHQPDGHEERPLTEAGHLDPDWVAGDRAHTSEQVMEQLGVWTELAAIAHSRQVDQLAALAPHPALATARSESMAEVLCAELERSGLPIDLATAEAVIGSFVGPRPRDVADAARLERARDDAVLRHAPAGADFDLRNPAQVRSLLRRVGVEVPDTRAWRLEARRDEHPVVEALLAWRKAERVATTFGYAWLDEHVGDDSRLHGSWSSSDGAAGRMTATAGLHNMPADLRSAIRAEEGHVFVRADLRQIEPRVLAAVSGDPVLARATADDDMYQPVADRLRVDRDIAKVAVLGAMYGQTTGRGAEALAGLDAAYPIAMGHLRQAADDAAGGNDLRTYGGRRIRMGDVAEADMSDRDRRARAAARGRYGRNALIQGAAAELFKTWAVLTRARTTALGGEIVLCLHDELLVHAPVDAASETAAAVDAALAEAAGRWAPAGGTHVRFVADTSIVTRWSDAK